MTNPNNAVGTNAGFGGRTSPNAFNDNLALYSRGIASGWACTPKSGMTVQIGGNGTNRDVAIAEDNAGDRTTINNRSGLPIDVTISGAPATGNRIDSIVAYVENPAAAQSTDVDYAPAVGLITVKGTASGSPVAPTENQIRTAITADGSTGATAYYVILANITVGQGVTTIGAGVISAGPSAKNSALQAVIAQLNLNDIQTKTLTFNGNRTANVTLAQNSDGSLFKFYGQFYFDNNTTSAINLNTSSFAKTAIPGASNAYGFATGLYLNTAPSSAYLIAPAGYGAFGTLGYNKTNTGYMDAGNLFAVQIYVGTNGQIYIAPFGNNWNSGNEVVSANTRNRIFWLPQLYWNTNFGDGE